MEPLLPTLGTFAVDPATGLLKPIQPNSTSPNKPTLVNDSIEAQFIEVAAVKCKICGLENRDKDALLAHVKQDHLGSSVRSTSY